jgi:hypothetical protein
VIITTKKFQKAIIISEKSLHPHALSPQQQRLQQFDSIPTPSFHTFLHKDEK